ncbi:MAG: DHH family phosphoesterase, partial [Thalassolituus sp.]
MTQFDIFNGDADGICALIQLRLAEPRNSTLITGVKRDIKLVRKANAKAGDELTVLDISMEKNTDALIA